MTPATPITKEAAAGPPEKPGSASMISESRRHSASHVVTVVVPAERPALVRYSVAVGATLLALGATLPLQSTLQHLIFVLFWPAVIGSAWFGGVGPAVLASVLAVASVDYLIIVPGRLAPTSADDLIPLGVFLFASTSVALLTGAARTARQAAADAAAQNAELAQELEQQAIELEQQLEESQALSEELEQSTEELAERTAAAEEAEAFSRGVLKIAERSSRVADRLFALTARLSAAATPAAVADAVLAEARATFNPDRATMTLIDEDGTTARSLATFGYADDDMSRWRSYSVRDWEPPRQVVATGQGVFIESTADARAQFPNAASALEALGVETAVILPIADGRVIGVMSMSWNSAHPLPADEREFMELFASQCGQALGRAIAFEAERIARERTQRLQRITSALAGAGSEREVADVFVANLRDVLGPRSVEVYGVVEDGAGPPDLVLMDASGVGDPGGERFGRTALDGETPIADVVLAGEPVFVSDDAAFRARFPRWQGNGRRDGEQAWVALPLKGSTGTPLAAVALGFGEVREFRSDLCNHVGAIADQARQAFERVRLLEAEHRARESAEEANRAKTQFLATMSHELRTPLNAISGYAELLSLGLRGPTTPEQQEDLGRIMRSQRHLLSVINDILNFARLEAGHVEYHVTDVPVSSLLGDVESLIRPQLVSKHLEFVCDVVPNDLVVRADPEKVRQVLLNLLANAVKFTPPGGSIRLTCDHDRARVRIRVVDTGIGIPADRRAAIFEPFVQLHRTLAQPAEGTGLGLAISRDLARGMGGELTVEGEPGLGSTFTLTLDRSAARPVA
jgi:signal transduction histidine kinase